MASTSSQFVPGGGRVAKRASLKLGDAGGASNGEFIATSDMTEYLVKRRSRCFGSGPHIPLNEVVAAELAALIDIPVLPWDYIQMPDGEIGFGSLRMPNEEFSPMTPEVADALREDGLLAAVAIFDLWICNTDRHNQNLVGRRSRERGGGYQLLANDHSHALLREDLAASEMTEHYDHLTAERPASFFRSQILRERVSDGTRLRDTLGAVEAIDESSVRAILDGLPAEWADTATRQFVGDFLVGRAREAKALLSGVQALFPQLNGVVF